MYMSMHSIPPELLLSRKPQRTIRVRMALYNIYNTDKIDFFHRLVSWWSMYMCSDHAWPDLTNITYVFYTFKVGADVRVQVSIS